jgi:hypothetical protein
MQAWKDLFPSSVGVSAKARFDTEVTQLTAIDPDKKSSNGITYKIDSLQLIPEYNRIYAPDSFRINKTNGKIYTNALMEMYIEIESHFKLKIWASDANSSTQASLRVSILQAHIQAGIQAHIHIHFE